MSPRITAAELAQHRRCQAQPTREPGELAFFIPGVPRTTQTGSVIRLPNGRAFPLRRGTSWSAACGAVARQYAPSRPFTGPVAVTLTFIRARLKGKARLYATTRPDVENLCKGLLDAWNGVLWQDDAQIVKLTLEKDYGDAPGVGVRVFSLDALVADVATSVADVVKELGT